ncbi:winged helix-turn-helix transcriptional regulator [Nocardioides mesophilus]|uniref:Winged helix-turn-helix transcriptional regulator n=1 Tax=Nocardioides mesophilus TaxID=433659 RepID=A0A7G9RGF7_9ACTN|nr:winged helix-turn-helix transcriptional regulator [Nocardioides mesophilus]QNN54682.1 winged helix-turn-helix transcriptional regulator [Nocardioides mesophilus]
MKYADLADADCAIAQALGVVGEWWSLLVVRDVAGGLHRFEELQRELGISRKVLTQRLTTLVEHGVLERRPYSAHPPRHEYHLTDKGRGLLPVLVALQDWGTRHVLGDGSLTATSAPTSPEAARVQDLVGKRLEVTALTAHTGVPVDPVGRSAWTVLYCFPGADAPGGRFYPPGWGEIPGAAGCTLESTTLRDRYADFAAAGVTVHGVSTQRPDQLAAFAEHTGLPFELLSDVDLELAASLRLPTFRAAGTDRLKRLTLLLDVGRVVRDVLFPITDPAGSVDDVLALVRARSG